MLIKDLIKHLKTYPEDMPVAYSLWQPDDVTALWEEKFQPKGAPVLPKDAYENILGIFHRTHSCTEGLTWLGLEYCMEQYLEDIMHWREGEKKQ